MRILVDIDSALVTQAPGGRRHTLPEALAKLKSRIERGQKVTLWSTRGLRYCRRFARDNGLEGCRCMVKPSQLISRL